MRYIFVLLLFSFLACDNQAQLDKNVELERENVALKTQVEGLQTQVTQLQNERKKTAEQIKSAEEQIKSLQRSARRRTGDQVRSDLGLKKGQKLFATIKTSMGDMTAELFVDLAPNTVANFVGLAEGTIPWTDPQTGQSVTRPLYPDTLIHRVMPRFMIQMGDPAGTGLGGPGYTFEDEFHPSLRHDSPGILSMANTSQPNTNGSQFFITEKATPHLNDRHSVFGKVIKNVELVKEIAHTPANASNRPLTPVVLEAVKIGRGSPRP